MSSDIDALLAKSRRLLASTSHLAAPKSTAAKTSTPAPAPLPEHASGPINRVMFLEGQRFAKDLVLSAQALLRSRAGTQELIDNLQRACTGRPASYAAGITTIIDLIDANNGGSENCQAASGAPRHETEQRKNVARNHAEGPPCDT